MNSLSDAILCSATLAFDELVWSTIPINKAAFIHAWVCISAIPFTKSLIMDLLVILDELMWNIVNSQTNGSVFMYGLVYNASEILVNYSSAALFLVHEFAALSIETIRLLKALLLVYPYELRWLVEPWN